MKFTLPGRLAIPFGLRIFVRGAFLLLALATVALALSVLREEKERSLRNFEDGFRKNHAQIAARLRHPTGQLALLNPGTAQRAVTPLRPLVLPFSAIDFDDKTKVQQAVEMAGCLVQYADGASLCVAVGNNPFAGGFIYIAGGLTSGDLVAHRQGDLDISTAHRVRITVTMRGATYRWIAPFETMAEAARVGPSGAPGLRGRLTGYVDGVPIVHGSRPVRDFRGWLWQDGRCIDAGAAATADCAKRSFVSVRLPVEIFREALFQKAQVVWPPPDLDQIQVHVQVLAPGDGAPLFDSNSEGASPPFSWAALTQLLLPGERLVVRRVDAPKDAPDVISLAGPADAATPAPAWLDRLIDALPVAGAGGPIEVRDSIDAPLGRYALVLKGDRRTVNQGLAAVTTRVSWYVVGMLLAILLTWLAIEVRIIRRITLLTRRAAAVSTGIRTAGAIGASTDLDLVEIDLPDLRGKDELGVLSRGLQDLLRRVNDDVRRERIRAEQEKDTWHAVGHEIMSPLQSLMALHGAPGDPSHRYISRMQQAVRVLYGSASPSEALQSTSLRLEAVDIDRFLGQVAGNAAGTGLDNVRYASAGAAVMVRADEYSLEDVVTHVLRNAGRHRLANTPTTLRLDTNAEAARIAIHNQGPAIEPSMLDKIFEYGVSAAPATGSPSQRGQGLFVARTYMAKMGGTICARNSADGVEFILTLPLVRGAAAA